MKILTLVGGLLLGVGIVGIVWGVIKMYEDRETVGIGDDIEIVVRDGNFPLVGTAGAVIGAAGLIVTLIGVTARPKS